MSEFTSENEAILEAAKQFGEVEFQTFNTGTDADPTIRKGVEIAAVPTNRTLHSIKKLLDEYRVRPERKTGTSTLDTVASFVDQVNRSKDANSVIFADVANRAAPK